MKHKVTHITTISRNKAAPPTIKTWYTARTI